MDRGSESNVRRMIGATIREFSLNDDGSQLVLFCDGMNVIFDPVGDCCSHSWIESIDMPENLRGKIISVENIDMPDLGDVITPRRDSVDRVRYYGLKIITDHGHVVIDYRNDSNGYYGGELEVSIEEVKNVESPNI